MNQLTVKRMNKLALGLAALMLCQPSFGATGSSALTLKPSLGYTYFNIQGAAAGAQVEGEEGEVAGLDYKYKGGNSAGVIAQYALDDAFEVELGLEYVETGAKVGLDLNDFISLTAAELTVGSLFVPIRAKYNFNPKSDGTRFNVRAGLAPTYLLSAKSKESFGETRDIKSEMNSFGVMTQVGLGMDWQILSGRLAADFNYNYGLTKIFKDTNGKSVGYQLALGYVLSL